ncbi:MAG: 30S ribosomal protein S20 [Nitrospiraceae bacterium]|nr:30S ribosomal protein S20 [Nitrospiraceae bacterium]
MPVIHKSTIKAARQSERRAQRNRAVLSSVKNIVKKVLAAVESKDVAVAKTALREATAALSKARSKGIFRRNTVSRRVSRLAARVNSLSVKA